MRYRYTKYAPNLIDGLDIDELTSKLSDLLLASGFGDGMGGPFDGADRTLQALHDAILEGLYAQKRISRTDERGYHGAEPARRPQPDVARTTAYLAPDDSDEAEERGAGRKKRKQYN